MMSIQPVSPGVGLSGVEALLLSELLPDAVLEAEEAEDLLPPEDLRDDTDAPDVGESSELFPELAEEVLDLEEAEDFEEDERGLRLVTEDALLPPDLLLPVDPLLPPELLAEAVLDLEDAEDLEEDLPEDDCPEEEEPVVQGQTGKSL